MFYRVVKVILWPIFRLAYRFSAKDASRLPAEGPVLIVANHASYLDPVVIGLAAGRPVRFMAKEQLFKIFGLGWIIRRLHSFPVKRDEFDRRAIHTALTALADGEVVGIFPQGTRQKDGVTEAFPGAAMIAFKSGATVVPVAISGTEKVMPDGARFPRWPRIVVSFGEPIKPDTGGDKKEVIARLTDRIVDDLRDMLEKWK